MLKRLFISLIILSALTSEGVMYLPGNMHSLCLISGNSANGALGENVTACGSTQNNAGALSTKSSASFCNAFIITFKSINKLKSSFSTSAGSLVSGKALSGPGGYGSVLSQPVCNNCIKDKKDIIIKRSDTSPPFTYSL